MKRVKEKRRKECDSQKAMPQALTEADQRRLETGQKRNEEVGEIKVKGEKKEGRCERRNWPTTPIFLVSYHPNAR